MITGTTKVSSQYYGGSVKVSRCPRFFMATVAGIVFFLSTTSLITLQKGTKFLMRQSCFKVQNEWFQTMELIVSKYETDSFKV